MLSPFVSLSSHNPQASALTIENRLQHRCCRLQSAGRRPVSVFSLLLLTAPPRANADSSFSGKYSAQDLSAQPSSGRFSDESRAGAMYRQRYFKDTTFTALSIIEPAVKAAGLTMIETAIRWCLHHSALRVGGTPGAAAVASAEGAAGRAAGFAREGADGIIVGVSSQEQLQGNLADCAKGPLPEEVVKALDEAWAACKGNQPNYWHLDLKYTYDTQEALFGRAKV